MEFLTICLMISLTGVDIMNLLKTEYSDMRKWKAVNDDEVVMSMTIRKGCVV